MNNGQYVPNQSGIIFIIQQFWNIKFYQQWRKFVAKIIIRSVSVGGKDTLLHTLYNTNWAANTLYSNHTTQCFVSYSIFCLLFLYFVSYNHILSHISIFYLTFTYSVSYSIFCLIFPQKLMQNTNSAHFLDWHNEITWIVDIRVWL